MSDPIVTHTLITILSPFTRTERKLTMKRSELEIFLKVEEEAKAKEREKQEESLEKNRRTRDEVLLSHVYPDPGFHELCMSLQSVTKNYVNVDREELYYNL